MSKRTSDSELQVIPGVGPSIAGNLEALGINTLAELRKQDPERLYDRLNALYGVRQDPCVLYVFRCAVYFARTEEPNLDLLKWWNWKDRRLEDQ